MKDIVVNGIAISGELAHWKKANFVQYFNRSLAKRTGKTAEDVWGLLKNKR